MQHEKLLVSTGQKKANVAKPANKKSYSGIRTPDFCFYCETEVHNFARHITRNHSGESEVQKVLSLEPKSLERKRFIACLRKKGNFISNSSKLFKPVHKSLLCHEERNYVPCPFCFGLYSKRLLWKHKKICPNNDGVKKKSLGEGQNLYVPGFANINSTLVNKVFPRMLADSVSLTAKKDSLICAYGGKFITTHREQHHVNVCSRKMRELAKVLIESKRIVPEIKNLFDILQPKYFDIVVQSVKVIARYDQEKDLFQSPTFAMNISRSLKDCCDIAVLHIIKRKYNYENIAASEAEANIGVFRRLLENMWKTEISHQAGNDLNTKSWNKVTIVPLATDLKLFRNYLIQNGSKAAKDLQANVKDGKAFTMLMETAFCRLLLLNRKRVGELQRLKLSTYLFVENENNKNYEEFAEVVSPAEKILMKNFKRVVTRGKRGRGVPVLFSKDIQEHIQLLLDARPHFISQKNLFLFASPSSEEFPITGYKVIQKHARLCGAKNPCALMSTKLRKHLATLTQIFSMNDNEIEQLATFMGHTVNVHKQVYRLPDDVYQTAKIAKLLMLMEKGEAGKYKGKTLDEVDISLDNELSESDNEKEDDTNIVQVRMDSSLLDDDIEESLETTNNVKSFEITRKGVGSKRILVPWTNQQKEVVRKFFAAHIKEARPPKREECERLKEKYPELLENKTWTKIKVFVQNIYTNKLKHS